MATKKSTSKKPATKKAAAKKPAPKKEVIKYTAADVVLNSKQAKSLEIVAANETRLHAKAQDMLKIAFDSGKRMLELKEQVQAKYGRVWKDWAQGQTENLGIGYEQVTRYMKLAANPTQYALLDDSVTSIEGAVKQIEYMKKPEKAKAAAEKKAAKPKIATAGIISNATLEEIEACTDVSELRGVIKLCHARIEELENLALDDPEPADAEADQADIETALS